MRIANLVLLAFLVGSLCGCASSSDQQSKSWGCPPVTVQPISGGHLVIVGGGLKKENLAVHERFVSLCADGPIGIIPIASGDGLAAGTSAAAGWRAFAGNRQVIVIPLTKDSKNANDADVANQIASCGGLWFTGGDQSRVTAILKPNGEQTESLKACFTVLLGKGGVIGGTSAGAAIMTDPMITGGQSPGRRTRDDDETPSAPSSVRIGAGLGFLPVGLTDQHFLERGRMGRLITALYQQRIPVGFGIRENCAMVVDLDRGLGEAMGDRAVCVLAPIRDVLNQYSTPRLFASLSVLSTGDSVRIDRGEFTPRWITPASGLTRPWTEPRPRSSQESASRRVRDVWDRAVVENALDRFANDPAQLTLQGEGTVLEFGGIASSRTYLDPAGKRPACLINVQVTFRPDRTDEPAR